MAQLSLFQNKKSQCPLSKEFPDFSKLTQLLIRDNYIKKEVVQN